MVSILRLQVREAAALKYQAVLLWIALDASWRLLAAAEDAPNSVVATAVRILMAVRVVRLDMTARVFATMLAVTAALGVPTVQRAAIPSVSVDLTVIS